jgi:hypothetical protein
MKLNFALILAFPFFLFPNISLAQQTEETTVDENFDPFSDYSEYMQTAEEEADINFFRSGRLLNMSLHAGLRSFSETLGLLYSPNLGYGLGITYFFDLRFAGYFGFTTSDHSFNLVINNNQTTGNVGVTFLSFDLKYYLNTDILIRPLSDINPYWLIGFNQTYRTLTLSASGDQARDSTLGLEFGGGIEIPILREQAFIGFQATYRYFNFVDESQNLIDPIALLPIDVKPKGDSYDLMLLMGINF